MIKSGKDIIFASKLIRDGKLVAFLRKQFTG